MITDLETLLNQDQFKQLVEAINTNQEYYMSGNGLTIKSESTDDSLFLLISYERQKEESCLANEEVDQFQKYLESLDDDLFIDVCEYLGELEVHKIQECLESGKLETVRAGIAKFKMALSDIAKKRIEQLKAQMRILLANINATMQALFHENEQLRKELEKLAAENKSLKEK